MLDLLISRLLTGRISLSEATIGHALGCMQRSWQYCTERKLWQGRKSEAPLMAGLPLVAQTFRDYGRAVGVVAHFLETTREEVAACIRNDVIPNHVVEATCMCKFLGTGFGVDVISAMRKLLGSRALQDDSWLGKTSFVANATCAAEGDNTIMELKICQDMVRGRTSMLPLGLMSQIVACPQGRRAVAYFMARLARASILGKAAMKDGQLLKDLAWARTHMRVIAAWRAQPGYGETEALWLESYGTTCMAFPVPLAM